MSILDAAYQLCKSVRKSPARSGVAEVILGLNFGDRERLGLHARRRQAQILGYLAVDQERSSLEQKGQMVPPLEEGERRLLAGVNKQIVELNRQCVAPLTTALPQCARAVDPYNRFRYVEPPAVADVHLLEPEAARDVVINFRAHPAITAAVESVNSIHRELSEDHYYTNVKHLYEDLMEYGALKSRKRLLEVLRVVHPTPARTHLRHIGALVCVRDSLANLNQLLFQAMLTDKLMFLDEENIIDVGVQIRHSGGHGIGLVCRQAERTILEDSMTDSGTIVLLKGAVLGRSDNMPFRIETLFRRFSREVGRTEQFEMRHIDENLNSFHPLLRGSDETIL